MGDQPPWTCKARPMSTIPSTEATDLKPLWGWPQLMVLIFTVAYLVPFAVVCVQGGNREFILYLGVMLFLMPTVAWLHQRIRLHVGTLWGLSLWGLAHLAGGLVRIPDSWPHDDSLVLYDWWLIPQRLRYDQVIHALGFGLTTWMCWQGLHGAFRAVGIEARPTFGLLALCVFGGMGLGALNEIVEFIAVLTIPNTNVGGYVNTGWDLVANGVGAVCTAVLIAAFKPARGK